MLRPHTCPWLLLLPGHAFLVHQPGPFLSSSTHPLPWHLTLSFKNTPSVRASPGPGHFPNPFQLWGEPRLPPPGGRWSGPSSQTPHVSGDVWAKILRVTCSSTAPATWGSVPMTHPESGQTPRGHGALWPCPYGLGRTPASRSPALCPSPTSPAQGGPRPPDFKSQTPPTLGSLEGLAPTLSLSRHEGVMDDTIECISLCSRPSPPLDRELPRGSLCLGFSL